jgi:hypothetical protein
VADSISGGLLSGFGEWIGGLGTGSAGEGTYYQVTFPDGTRHAVPSGTVASSGAFTYQGVRYVLGTQNGQRVARYAS